MKESVLEQLKKETGDLHSRLEATSIATRIMAEDVTEADVLAFLGANFACLSGLEQHLEECLGEGVLYSNWGYIKQASHIEQDFLTLDLPIPKTYRPDFVISTCHAVGGLYVLMGSQFGKAVIRKHLVNKKLDRFSRLRFFEDAGSLGERWRLFSSKLDQTLVAEQAMLQSKSGARLFFTHFLRHWSM